MIIADFPFFDFQVLRGSFVGHVERDGAQPSTTLSSTTQIRVRNPRTAKCNVTPHPPTHPVLATIFVPRQHDFFSVAVPLSHRQITITFLMQLYDFGTFLTAVAGGGVMVVAVSVVFVVGGRFRRPPFSKKCCRSTPPSSKELSSL